MASFSRSSSGSTGSWETTDRTPAFIPGSDEIVKVIVPPTASTGSSASGASYALNPHYAYNSAHSEQSSSDDTDDARTEVDFTQDSLTDNSGSLSSLADAGGSFVSFTTWERAEKVNLPFWCDKCKGSYKNKEKHLSSRTHNGWEWAPDGPAEAKYDVGKVEPVDISTPRKLRSGVKYTCVVRGCRFASTDKEEYLAHRKTHDTPRYAEKRKAVNAKKAQAPTRPKARKCPRF
ncbi:hypothetical protein CC1G_11808 [Coprinopsis cinerea okayama7|uniref:C2H2-type domain-containing protein n=1 Tax=Coprinopsis cinerea (strain Okayama-7 / 130 / ATCC MYA-4618 / FGSC 9003) TaxID=240176 RepID=A8N815_COPC7|nr:hypothetical protein CC1G_11808 [Coprinopsis cinerea okayama7\|eukprot:XP_001830971.1 hypothetical protein CC1G_11808 [Coprinopsis cinerea okayama7\